MRTISIASHRVLAAPLYVLLRFFDAKLIYTVLAILLWILFFLQKSRLNPFVHLSIIFFQYTDTEVRLEHWKTLNSSIFS